MNVIQNVRDAITLLVRLSLFDDRILVILLDRVGYELFLLLDRSHSLQNKVQIANFARDILHFVSDTPEMRILLLNGNHSTEEMDYILKAMTKGIHKNTQGGATDTHVQQKVAQVKNTVPTIVKRLEQALDQFDSLKSSNDPKTEDNDHKYEH